MTLAQIRTALRTLLFDTAGDAYTDAQLLDFINRSMHHVANLAIAAQPHLLLHTYTGTLSNGSSADYITVDLSGQTYTRARKIVFAQRTGLSGQESTLQITDFANIDKLKGASMKPRPQVFLFNETLGFVQPTDNITVSVVYVHSLGDMSADTDSPGVAGGTGTANKLPVEWQSLIVLRAGLLALSADRRDSADLRSDYAELRDTLLSATGVRRMTHEGPV